MRPLQGFGGVSSDTLKLRPFEPLPTSPAWPGLSEGLKPGPVRHQIHQTGNMTYAFGGRLPNHLDLLSTIQETQPRPINARDQQRSDLGVVLAIEEVMLTWSTRTPRLICSSDSTSSLLMKRSAPTQSFPVIDATEVVQFYVLLGENPARTSFNLNDSLVELFARLRQDQTTSNLIPAKATPSNCTFYQLKNPVLFTQPRLKTGDAFLREAKRNCEDIENRLHVEPITTTVRVLAPQFTRDYAYLVIEPPNRKCHIFLGSVSLSLSFSIPGVRQ